MREVTYTDRLRASRFITRLRNQMGRRKVAEKLGICPTYVSIIEHMHKRSRENLKYTAPAKIVLKVLELEAAHVS